MRMRTTFAVSITAIFLLFAFPALGNATSLNIGPTLQSYYFASSDIAFAQVLVLYSNYAFPAAGSVTYFQSYVQPGGNLYGGFQVMLLRPEGPNQYHVVAAQAFDVPAVIAPTLYQYSLSSPWTVQAGDIYAHFGNGIPFNYIGDWKSDPSDLNMPDPLYYPCTAPLLDTTISLSSPAYPLFDQLRDYGLVAIDPPPNGDPETAPEPGSLLLLGTGLGTLGLAVWRRKK
jgi:hypothetical protein